MHKRRIYFLTVNFAFFLFAVLWFYLCNRYYVLYYHEQIQLFQFNGLYFHSYLGIPGGLCGYAGAFLTQFYVYPFAGAFILASVLLAVLLLFYQILQTCGNMGQLFFIPFIPAVLLMAAFANIHFNMSPALGLLFVLAGLRLYFAIPLPERYGAGPALFAIIYFVAGGNALLLPVMIMIFELTCRVHTKEKGKKKDTVLYLLLLFIWSMLLPWLAWRMIYTVPVREAYCALTPANFPFPTISNIALWLSFPVLYLCCRLFAPKINLWNFSMWKALVVNGLLIVVITAYGAHKASDRRAEMLNRMVFDLHHDNWNSVLTLGKNFPNSNRMVIYLTNIALAESGQMPYHMFQYRQIGIAGLFLDWQLNYVSLLYQGEIYYRLGIISEAEHCAFEALVSSPRGPNAQVLQRLVITNIVRRDSLTADKYLGYFDQSLAYRKWAHQQRENLIMAMADTAFHLPYTPPPYRHSDFFMDYKQPDQTLIKLLESNPKHVLAFEYLMSYYMLQKDIERVKWCMDNFYKNFDYQSIPTHYEEALLVYENLMRTGDDFFKQYPVSRTTRDRFERYAQAFKATQGSMRYFEQLEKQFNNTYWYYWHFIEPFTLQNKDEQNRY